MFRFLILSIFALFAVLAVAGVERSTIATTDPAPTVEAAVTPDDAAQLAVVLQSVTVLERPRLHARVTGHFLRGDRVLVKRVASGGWTQAQSPGGVRGFIPSYTLSGPSHARDGAVY